MREWLRHIFAFVAAVLRQWGALATGGIIIGAIAIYEHATGKAISGWPFWIAVAASLFIAFFLAWLSERLRVESARPSPITPKDLVDVFEGRTTVQAEKLTVIHIGKWIEVSGKVNDIRTYRFPFSYLASLTLSIGQPISDQPLVFCFFGGRKSRSQLSVLRKEETVTVRGQVEEIQRHTVSLRRCELIKFS